MRTGGRPAGSQGENGRNTARCLMAMSNRELRPVRRVRIKLDMRVNWHP